MSARLLLTDADRFPFGPVDRKRICAAGIDLVELPDHDPTHVRAAADGTVALLVYHLRVDADLIDRLRDCMVIARCGAGYDNIDVPAARAHDIRVTYVPDYGSIDVAEHSIALMLAMAKRIGPADRAMRAGRWPAPAQLGLASRLSGRTLGLLGFGRIAREVSLRAIGLGLQVQAYDPHVSIDDVIAEGVLPVSLNSLLADADILSLHLPLTPETRHVLDTRAFHRLKNGALLVNTGRGGLIDESALVTALDSGRLAGVALDVFEHEPPYSDDPLLRRDDVLLTPHSAAFTTEALAEVRSRALDDALRVVSGLSPRHPVPEDI